MRGHKFNDSSHLLCSQEVLLGISSVYAVVPHRLLHQPEFAITCTRSARPAPRQKRQQDKAPDGRSHARPLPRPGGLIGRIHLHQLDPRPFTAQQLGELARLVGHAARGRGQGTDEGEAQTSVMPRRASTKPPYTGT